MKSNRNKLRLTINTAVPKDLLYDLITYNMKNQAVEEEEVKRLPVLLEGCKANRVLLPFFTKHMSNEMERKMLDLLSSGKMGIKAVRADVMIKETGQKTSDLIIEMEGPTVSLEGSKLFTEMSVLRSLLWRLYVRLSRGLE